MNPPWEQKAGVDYCPQIQEQGQAFFDRLRTFYDRERKYEGALYDDAIFQGWVNWAVSVAHDLDEMLPSPCGKCEWCVNEAVKRGECPEGWSDPYICPDCRARRRLK